MSSPQFNSYASILTSSYAMIVYGKVILITDAQKTRDYTLRFWLLRYRKLVLSMYMNLHTNYVCLIKKYVSPYPLQYNTKYELNSQLVEIAKQYTFFDQKSTFWAIFLNKTRKIWIECAPKPHNEKLNARIVLKRIWYMLYYIAK